nr:response regulator [uncultured Arsenicibacter sp.]
MHRTTRGFPVLFIDDNSAVIEVADRAMKKVFPEANVVYIQSVESAKTYLEKPENIAYGVYPKLILLDIHLPDRTDGWYLLDFLRNHPKWRLTPVVMLTSSDDDMDVLESYRQGASSFIGKPDSYIHWQDCLRAIRNYWYDAVKTV